MQPSFNSLSQLIQQQPAQKSASPASFLPMLTAALGGKNLLGTGGGASVTPAGITAGGLPAMNVGTAGIDALKSVDPSGSLWSQFMSLFGPSSNA